MTHDQLRDIIFISPVVQEHCETGDDILSARRRAQAHQLKAERSRLISNMINWSERVSKIDSLLQLLE